MRELIPAFCKLELPDTVFHRSLDGHQVWTHKIDDGVFSDCLATECVFRSPETEIAPCGKGHPVDRQYLDLKGAQICRTCRSERRAAHRAKKWVTKRAQESTEVKMALKTAGQRG